MANNDITAVSLIASQAVTATVTPSNGTDLSAYDGEMTFILDCGAATAGTDPTMNVTIQASSVIDGSGDAFATIGTFTEVTDAADSLQEIKLNIGDQEKFIRAVATIGGTSSPSFPLSVVAVGSKKYQS